MSRRKYYKPGREGGTFSLRRYNDENVLVISVEIGSAGFSTTDAATISELDRHPLKGHKDGFIEIEPPQRTRSKKRAAAKAAEKTTAKDETGEPKPEPSGTIIGNYRIEEKGGGYKNVVHIESGEVANGEKGLRPEDAEELAKELSGLETPPAEDDGDADSGGSEGDDITPEDITNINQAKDWLQKQPDVDGRKLTSKKKILEKAKELGVEFPNLD